MVHCNMGGQGERTGARGDGEKEAYHDVLGNLVQGLLRVVAGHSQGQVRVAVAARSDGSAILGESGGAKGGTESVVVNRRGSHQADDEEEGLRQGAGEFHLACKCSLATSEVG